MMIRIVDGQTLSNRGGVQRLICRDENELCGSCSKPLVVRRKNGGKLNSVVATQPILLCERRSPLNQGFRYLDFSKSSCESTPESSGGTSS